MIKFKTKVLSPEKGEKSEYMSDTENEYTYYSTAGYTTCVSISGRNLMKVSAKSKVFFSKLFPANERTVNENFFKQNKLKRGEKSFDEEGETFLLDKRGNMIETDIFQEASVFQGMRECIYYKSGKVNEVRYYSKDGELTIEHYDLCGKLCKISKEKY